MKLVYLGMRLSVCDTNCACGL